MFAPIINVLKIVFLTILTAVMAAGTWLRCRYEAMLDLLPGQTADRPGGRRIGQPRRRRASRTSVLLAE
ncbi:hypothetical protein [Streptomyces sp. NPDC050848]|uniref:hypothetical protein n=1 Tax=Streptomyces sp. NPDC050848 TaxID=3155791 RepID=UPI0033C4AC9B